MHFWLKNENIPEENTCRCVLRDKFCGRETLSSCNKLLAAPDTDNLSGNDVCSRKQLSYNYRHSPSVNMALPAFASCFSVAARTSSCSSSLFPRTARSSPSRWQTPRRAASRQPVQAQAAGGNPVQSKPASIPTSLPSTHAPAATPPPPRIATVSRETRETTVSATVNLDGTGVCDVDTGIPFLDHMLAQLCSHGLLDLCVRARGDYEIDDHHTNEDVGITLGLAVAKAAGSKAGIRRFGHFVAPLDESLVEIILDFSGRPHTSYGLELPTQRVGTYDTQLVREFYIAFADNAKVTLHVVQRYGLNSHHIIEASFKAFARAMRMALDYDPRRMGSIPSSKGVLTDEQAVDDA